VGRFGVCWLEASCLSSKPVVLIPSLVLEDKRRRNNNSSCTHLAFTLCARTRTRTPHTHSTLAHLSIRRTLSLSLSLLLLLPPLIHLLLSMSSVAVDPPPAFINAPGSTTTAAGADGGGGIYYDPRKFPFPSLRKHFKSPFSFHLFCCFLLHNATRVCASSFPSSICSLLFVMHTITP
jgi:hypothetical protein